MRLISRGAASTALAAFDLSERAADILEARGEGMKDKWSWKIRGAGVRWKKGIRATENERCETASHLTSTLYSALLNAGRLSPRKPLITNALIAA